MDALQVLSLQPGGFGAHDRPQKWLQLLGVPVAGAPTRAGSADAHTDERQVGLDTDRSFVAYPVRMQTGPGGTQYR